MVVGIQTNKQSSLPGVSEKSEVSGRSPSGSTLGRQPEPEPVEIPTSSATATNPSAIVQMDFSGTRALIQALLAGDQASPDPTTTTQATPVQSVQNNGGDFVVAAEAPYLESWIPQTLASQFGQELRLGSKLLDIDFIQATHDLAARLLAAGNASARVVPPARPAQAESGDSELTFK